MRAVVVRAFGAPETFKVDEIAAPAVGPRDVRVQVHAAGVNVVDALVASGSYQVKPNLPFIPGGEFAGVVDAVGADVQGIGPGDRVCGSTVGGAYGEVNVLDQALVFKIPDSMDFVRAATFRTANGTAYHALVQRAALKAGETVLVLGAGGAVGYAAVQIAKALGARVIASASSQAKRDMALAGGADAAIQTGAEDWRDQVKQAAGRPVDVVVDPVGGDLTELAFRSLGWGGRHLVIGFVGGIPRLPTNLALVKGAGLLGVDIRQFSQLEPVASQSNMRALFELFEAGKMPGAPTKVYPLERFAEAMAAIKGADFIGRAALAVRP